MFGLVSELIGSRSRQSRSGIHRFEIRGLSPLLSIRTRAGAGWPRSRNVEPGGWFVSSWSGALMHGCGAGVVTLALAADPPGLRPAPRQGFGISNQPTRFFPSD